MNKNLFQSILYCNLFIIPIYVFLRWFFLKNKIIVSYKYEILLLSFICYLLSVAAITIVPLPFAKVNMGYMNYIPVINSYNYYFEELNKHNDKVVFILTENIWGNILLFLPLGFLLPLILNFFKSFFRVLLLAILFSFCIEFIQFIETHWNFYRESDVDDIILNTLGAIIGYAFYKWGGKKLIKSIVN